MRNQLAIVTREINNMFAIVELKHIARKPSSLFEQRASKIFKGRFQPQKTLSVTSHQIKTSCLISMRTIREITVDQLVYLKFSS